MGERLDVATGAIAIPVGLSAAYFSLCVNANVSASRKRCEPM